MAKGFVQTDISKRFIDNVSKLIESDPQLDYTTIAEKISYDKSSISNVVKGRRNIPYEKYKEFTDLYNLTDSEPKELSTKQELLNLKAAIKVLTLLIIESRMKETGKSLVDCTREIEAMIQRELGG